MAPCPISYQEIEAYRRVTLTPLDAWDIRLIVTLDDLRLKLMAEAMQPKSPAAKPATSSVSLDNGKGVADFFRVLAVKQNARQGSSASAAVQRSTSPSSPSAP